MATVPAEPKVIWEPAAGPQTTFLTCPYYEVFYGGAAGGGKSDCLLVDALGQAHLPGYRALLLRRTFPELRELIDRSKALYPAVTGGKARYRGDEKVWTFPSGARIEFGYLNHEDDMLRYQGQQYAWVGFDELTHFDERAYFYVLSRVRAPSSSEITCYVRATSNPGGRGHGWVKARFVDPAPDGNVPLHDPVTGTTRIYIPSRLKDNPHLFNTDYGKRLLALPEADRKALLEGRWDAYEGSVFTLVPGIHRISWREFMARHETDKPGQIPDGWRRFRTMDWGLARPYACHWYAVDYDGTAYVYRERYGVKTEADGKFKPDVGNRLEPSKVGEMIANVEADADEAIALGWTGPDLFTSGRADVSAGIKIYEHFLKHGVVFTPWTAGPGSRRAKKAAFHERLYYEKNPETGEIVTPPGIVFIEEECPHAIRTIQALEYDKALGGEDVDTSMEDHCYDGVSGFCLMRPWAPKRKPTGLDAMFPRRGHGEGGQTWLSR